MPMDTNKIADHILDLSMADIAVYFFQTVVHYSVIQYEIFKTSMIEIHIGAVVFLDWRYHQHATGGTTGITPRPLV